MEKLIEFMQLADIGRGSAKITPQGVEIEISGINGPMKAWLIGGEAVAVGNIVDGKLRKQIDTTKHMGVLITQGGRQMLIGKYGEAAAGKESAPKEENTPFEAHGFNWKKVTQRNYAHLCRELRYIMSNTSVYENYKKYGHYWIGESSGGNAVALSYKENEPNPFKFLAKMKTTENGYVIVCVDKKTKKLYVP